MNPVGTPKQALSSVSTVFWNQNQNCNLKVWNRCAHYVRSLNEDDYRSTTHRMDNKTKILKGLFEKILVTRLADTVMVLLGSTRFQAEKYTRYKKSCITEASAINTCEVKKLHEHFIYNFYLNDQTRK